jgi:hypothetical protein
MLPTNASPVAMDSTSAEKFRQFLAQRRNTPNHVDRGETCKTSLICLVNKRRPPIGHYRVTDVLVDYPSVAAIEAARFDRTGALGQPPHWTGYAFADEDRENQYDAC